ncbi:hypothetical protein ACO2Q3_21260 [Caulobacter sp. KR2-114]|uniref:hypothetical protein n=1 Tax=Caulobacter sp. KR2-114 TaxID=3400912 RepID=UPI003BFAF0B4
MPSLDHIAIWTHRRDALLAALADAAGMAAVDGYSPDGQVVARGVRFANGPFLDVHQLPDAAPAGPARALVALRAPVDEIVGLADRHGWRVKPDRREDSADPHRKPPWSLVSFRRGQGLLSQLFAIDYHPGATTPADYAVPLYDPAGPCTGAACLDRVWLPVDDPAAARLALSDLGGRPCGALPSPWAVDGAHAFALGPAQLVVVASLPGALRLDLAAPGAPQTMLAPIDGLQLHINAG